MFVIYDTISGLYYNRIDKCLKPLKQTTAIYSTINSAKRDSNHVVDNIRKHLYRIEHNLDRCFPVYYTQIHDYHPEINLVIKEISFSLGKIVEKL